MKSQFYYPSRVILESGGFRRVAAELPAAAKRILVISGQQAMRTAGVLAEIEIALKQAGKPCFFYEGVNTNPTDIEIDKICRAREEFAADCVVGIGGGSSLDAAKLVAMQATNGGSVWDYINLTERPAKKIVSEALPIIAIPTTSGTGSESTPFAVLTHSVTRMKKGVGNTKLYPSLVILDPELLCKMPPRIVAITGLDAFGQALEAYTSGRATFHSDYYGYSALQYLIPNLERSWAEPDNHEAKAAVAWGAFLSGLAIGLVDVNLAHAMSHPISAHYGMQHGLAVFNCTIPAIQFNRSCVAEKYHRVAALFPGEKRDQRDLVDLLIDRLQAWAGQFELPLGLKNYGVPAASLDVFTQDALQIGAIKTNPRPVAAHELRVLYEKAWNGDVH